MWKTVPKNLDFSGYLFRMAFYERNYGMQLNELFCDRHLMGPTSISAINTAEGKKGHYYYDYTIDHKTKTL